MKSLGTILVIVHLPVRLLYGKCKFFVAVLSITCKTENQNELVACILLTAQLICHYRLPLIEKVVKHILFKNRLTEIMMPLHLKITSSNWAHLQRGKERKFFPLLGKQRVRAAKGVMICQSYSVKVKSRNIQLHQNKQL